MNDMNIENMFIQYRNDWERNIYMVNGDVIVDLMKVFIGGKYYDVTKRKVSIPYDDMGRTYEGISYHYFIKEEVFGIPMEFDLNQVVPRVQVLATSFKTKG